VTIRVAILSFAVLSCGGSSNPTSAGSGDPTGGGDPAGSGNPPGGGNTPGNGSPPDGGDPPRNPEGAAQLGPNCGVFTPGPLPATAWWQTESPGRCLEPDDPRLRHDIRQLYDSCTPQRWMPLACDIPLGAQYCAGRWTAVCGKSSDCGPLASCFWGTGVGDKPDSVSFGTCERRCTTDLDCIRCDLQCDKELGVCREKIVIPPRED